MKTEIVSKENQHKINSFFVYDRLEEMTCRPVLNGKRIPVSGECIEIIYLSDDSEEPAGKFSLFDFNERNRSAEFGYIVNPIFRNKGIGFEMLIYFTNKIFSKTSINKLHCQTASFNKPSIAILVKAGFKKDAVLREHHELDGKLYDDYIYSLLRSDWKRTNLRITI